jgi:hypothetical protein
VYVEVLGVVDVFVVAGLDRIEHPRLQVEEDGTRNVARVVGLVEEDIFAVAAFGRIVLEVSVFVDTVLLAELLPELLADYTVLSAPSYLGCKLGRCAYLVWSMWGMVKGYAVDVPLLPHWPAWSVIISLWCRQYFCAIRIGPVYVPRHRVVTRSDSGTRCGEVERVAKLRSSGHQSKVYLRNLFVLPFFTDRHTGITSALNHVRHTEFIRPFYIGSCR